MKIYIPYSISLAAIVVWIGTVGIRTQAQTSDLLLTDFIDQSAFPQVTAQPLDQAVTLGSNVVLSVQAANADSFQWLRNGVPVDGQTNCALIIENVGIADTGLYSCDVSKDGETVPTRTATLSVVTPAAAGGGPITVYGTPILSGGKRGSCPGPYAGYVIYAKTISQGWGWSPAGTVHAVADGSGRTNSKIEYTGAYGDSGCGQTSVPLPHPAFSPVYRFAIYFTNNVPTNAYPISLTGFNR
jgi:hypothetical protein